MKIMFKKNGQWHIDEVGEEYFQISGTIYSDINEYLKSFNTDEIELFEERAAIAEYDGKLSRDDAEHLAFTRVMIRRNILN